MGRATRNRVAGHLDGVHQLVSEGDTLHGHTALHLVTGDHGGPPRTAASTSRARRPPARLAAAEPRGRPGWATERQHLCTRLPDTLLGEPWAFLIQLSWSWTGGQRPGNRPLPQALTWVKHHPRDRCRPTTASLCRGHLRHAPAAPVLRGRPAGGSRGVSGDPQGGSPFGYQALVSGRSSSRPRDGAACCRG